MFSGNKNLIKSILIVILSSSLPINNAKANIFNRFTGNQFLGKWCASRVVTNMGETKIPSNQIQENCYIFKNGGELIYITTAGNGKSKYEVLDNKNILIIPPNGETSTLKYNRNTKEISLPKYWSGDLYGYSVIYLRKQ